MLPFFAGLGACAAAAISPPPVAPAPPPATHAAHAVPHPAQAAPPEPHAARAPATRLAPGLARPANPACTWTTQAWSTSNNPLSLTPGGQPFAIVIGSPSATAVLPTGNPMRALWTRAADGGTRVTGWWRARALYPARALPVSSIAFVKPETPLHVRTVEANAIAVDPPRANGLTLTTAGPLHAACTDVFPWPVRFDVRRAAGVPTRPVPVKLGTGRDIPLRAAPKGPRLGTFHSKDATYAERFAKRDGQDHVVFDAGNLLVVAWVPSSALTAGETYGSIDTLGHGAGEVESTLHCVRELPLLVELGGRTVQVGTVAARTPLHTAGQSSGLTDYALGWLKPARGALFVVPADARASCTFGPR